MMNPALQKFLNNAPSNKVQDVVNSLPKAVVEAAEDDKVNPPESKDALPAAMSEAPEPKPKGRGRGRKAAAAAPAVEGLTGKVVYAEAVDDGCVRVSLELPAGSVVLVGGAVKVVPA